MRKGGIATKMPLKFPKNVSTKLFRYVRTIDLKFNRKFSSPASCDCRNLSPLTTPGFARLCENHNMATYCLSCSSTALDDRTTSIRELLRQVRAKRFKQANPKLAINVDIHNRPSEPTAHFAFADGTDSLFQTKDYIAPEIMFQVHLKGMQLDAEYEMAGKSLDDEN